MYLCKIHTYLHTYSTSILVLKEKNLQGNSVYTCKISEVTSLVSQLPNNLNTWSKLKFDSDKSVQF